MGGSESKPKQPSLLDRPDKKDTDIKILPQSELPKLDLQKIDMPKAPIIKSKKMLKEEAESEERKNMLPFSLNSQYDLTTYKGRFSQQLGATNPLLFFTSNKRILEAKDLIEKQKMREEAAKRLGQQVHLKPEQIEELKKADKIVGGAVHPDTNEIIPFFMRLSGFVIFNTPIALICIFKTNQTPLFNAGM